MPISIVVEQLRTFIAPVLKSPSCCLRRWPLICAECSPTAKYGLIATARSFRFDQTPRARAFPTSGSSFSHSAAPAIEPPCSSRQNGCGNRGMRIFSQRPSSLPDGVYGDQPASVVSSIRRVKGQTCRSRASSSTQVCSRRKT